MNLERGNLLTMSTRQSIDVSLRLNTHIPKIVLYPFSLSLIDVHLMNRNQKGQGSNRRHHKVFHCNIFSAVLCYLQGSAKNSIRCARSFTNVVTAGPTHCVRRWGSTKKNQFHELEWITFGLSRRSVLVFWVDSGSIYNLLLQHSEHKKNCGREQVS